MSENFENVRNYIEESISNAIAGNSKLNQEILSLEGMSSFKNRHLLNNIIAKTSNVNYLEIGVWKGSTFISSLYQNDVISAYAIDNWSQFNDDKETKATFLKNCNMFNITNFVLLENDCFNIDLNDIKHKINVYFYDGHHSAESTCNALSYYYNILDDIFIFIVDDFDWRNPQIGTIAGIKKCNLNILYEQHLKSNKTNDNSSWWNGIYISILKK
jgi:hypothetical protein